MLDELKRNQMNDREFI